MNQRTSGALLSYALIVARLAITLAFTPVLVRSLGQEGYGLFALVGAMAAYLYILDFGINDSVIRYFVAHEKEPRKRDAFLSRMLSVYMVLGLLILAVTLLMVGLAGFVFAATLSPEQIVNAKLMLLVTGAGAAVLIGLNPIGALLSADERWVFLRGLDIVAAIVSTSIMYLVLMEGLGAVAIVVVTAGAIVVQALIKLVYVSMRMGVRVRLAWPDRIELRSVGGYAAPIFVSMIAEALFWKFDSILIGAVLGTAPVAVYAIGVTFNKYFMNFASALSRTMTPDIIRRIDQGADADTITQMMVRISRVQALMLLMILGGLTVFGQRFLLLWLGREFAISYWVMLAVLVPYALELTGNARNIVMQVKGLYWYKSRITFVTAAINIPLTVLMLQVWGVVGAAASTGISIFVGYFLIAIVLKQRIGLSMGLYWRETARGILPVAAGMVVTGIVLEPFLPVGWLWLFLGAILFSASYGLMMYLFAVNDYERGLFRRISSRLFNRKAPR